MTDVQSMRLKIISVFVKYSLLAAM